MRPDAARCGASNDLMIWIVASTFAGIVTSESSQISVLRKCARPRLSRLTPSAERPEPDRDAA